MSNRSSKNSAIFIFTKDRPNTLNQTLNSIQFIQITKYIIDDSFHNLNRKINNNIISTIPKAFHISKKEFDDFVNSRNIDLHRHNSLLNRIGNKEWNLGYVRNFALLFAKSRGLDKVVFMDDDILVPESNLVFDSFKLLNSYDFVGAHITGMLDDSIIGHMSRELGIDDCEKRMLSGGFLVFNPQIVEIPFTNFYNEDWIWLFLQLSDRKLLQKGKVIQVTYNPFLNFNERIIFQEFGEIIVTGILKLYEESCFEMLIKDSFWEIVLYERKEYLSRLYALSVKQEQLAFLSMIKRVKLFFSQFTGRLFQQSFSDFFNSLHSFRDLCLLSNKENYSNLDCPLR